MSNGFGAALKEVRRELAQKYYGTGPFQWCRLSLYPPYPGANLPYPFKSDLPGFLAIRRGSPL